MSAICRIIHLHGGPIDGLRLPWDGGLSETMVPLAAPSAGNSEYVYVYLPRIAKTDRLGSCLRLATRVTPSNANRWQKIWLACRVWLLADCSYPMDYRRYRIDAVAEHSLNRNNA